MNYHQLIENDRKRIYVKQAGHYSSEFADVLSTSAQKLGGSFGVTGVYEAIVPMQPGDSWFRSGEIRAKLFT